MWPIANGFADRQRIVVDERVAVAFVVFVNASVVTLGVVLVALAVNVADALIIREYRNRIPFSLPRIQQDSRKSRT